MLYCLFIDPSRLAYSCAHQVWCAAWRKHTTILAPKGAPSMSRTLSSRANHRCECVCPPAQFPHLHILCTRFVPYTVIPLPASYRLWVGTTREQRVQYLKNERTSTTNRLICRTPLIRTAYVTLAHCMRHVRRSASPHLLTNRIEPEHEAKTRAYRVAEIQMYIHYAHLISLETQWRMRSI